MSKTLFIILATGVTLGGLVAVVAGTLQVKRINPSKAKLIAILFLIGYAEILIFQPAAWPVIDLILYFE
jgi:hypothetical protein